MGVKNWGKIGEGVIGFLPQTNSILLFRPPTTVQNFMKIE